MCHTLKVFVGTEAHAGFPLHQIEIEIYLRRPICLIFFSSQTCLLHLTHLFHLLTTYFIYFITHLIYVAYFICHILFTYFTSSFFFRENEHSVKYCTGIEFSRDDSGNVDRDGEPQPATRGKNKRRATHFIDSY